MCVPMLWLLLLLTHLGGTSHARPALQRVGPTLEIPTIRAPMLGSLAGHYDGRSAMDWVHLSFPVVHGYWADEPSVQKIAAAQWLHKHIRNDTHRLMLWCMIGNGIDNYHADPDSMVNRHVRQSIDALIERWDPKSQQFSMEDEEVLLQITFMLAALDLPDDC